VEGGPTMRRRVCNVVKTVPNLSFRTIEDLGLLAKIKCCICSNQFNSDLGKQLRFFPLIDFIAFVSRIYGATEYWHSQSEFQQSDVFLE
jgi:hypothetical protein